MFLRGGNNVSKLFGAVKCYLLRHADQGGKKCMYFISYNTKSVKPIFSFSSRHCEVVNNCFTWYGCWQMLGTRVLQKHLGKTTQEASGSCHIAENRETCVSKSTIWQSCIPLRKFVSPQTVCHVYRSMFVKRFSFPVTFSRSCLNNRVRRRIKLGQGQRSLCVVLYFGPRAFIFCALCYYKTPL